jgi:hypothetical protein
MTNVQNASYKLVNIERENERYFESRDEAEAQRQELIGLDEDPDALEIVELSNDGGATTESGDATETDVGETHYLESFDARHFQQTTELWCPVVDGTKVVLGDRYVRYCPMCGEEIGGAPDG